MSDQISSDEAFARQLLEEEEKERKLMYEKDLELAKKLSESSIKQKEPIPNDTIDVIDLTDPTWITFEDQENLDVSVNQNSFFSDFLLAKQLEQKLIDRPEQRVIDEAILNDTIPDIHELFLLFNQLYFDNKLNTVELKWSTRMTRCAGTCTFKGTYCVVTLSEPLLKFRPKSDMVNTLLHEMIHALLFLTQRNTDRDGHGPEFLKEADRINKLAKTNITIYHNFTDEVDYYRTHVWQCNGTCQNKPPYFGLVKRAVNRPPQKADDWFEEHKRTCGGTFIKISSPAVKNDKKRKTVQQSNTLDSFVHRKKKKE